jgi:dolichol-phosphate mannosyltransferase
VAVIHRAGKRGIGSAHQEGIARAYHGGYETLVTLDCDFTHSPDEILKLLAETGAADVVIGSRFMRDDSLADWKLDRRILTNAGHFLTHYLLKVKQDATTAFRAYHLKTIPQEVFSLVRSNGYSFFFESLFMLDRNGLTIKEVPTAFLNRAHGESKLSLREAVCSVRRLLMLYFGTITRPQKFRLQHASAEDDRRPL